jgi:hypothetical protein
VTQEIFRRHKELDWHNFEFFEKDSVVVVERSHKKIDGLKSRMNLV